MKKPELLSPAGTLKNMRFAFAYGADAVYAGQPRYSLRVRNNQFSKEDVLAQGIAYGGGDIFFQCFIHRASHSSNAASAGPINS